MACNQMMFNACLRGMLFGLALVGVCDHLDLAISSFRRSFGTIGCCALGFQLNCESLHVAYVRF